MGWIDLYQNLKWVRGLVHLVHQNSIDVAKRQCRELGFSIITIDGSRIESEDSFHREIKETLKFPDYYGMNWNAFNDCIGDFYELNKGAHFCIFLEHFDHILSVNLKDALAIFHKLMNIDQGSYLRRGSYDPEQTQIEIFFCGREDSYDKA